MSAGQMGDDVVFCDNCGQPLHGRTHSSEGCISSLRASLAAANKQFLEATRLRFEVEINGRQLDAMRGTVEALSGQVARLTRERDELLQRADEASVEMLGRVVDEAHAAGRWDGLREALGACDAQKAQYVPTFRGEIATGAVEGCAIRIRVLMAPVCEMEDPPLGMSDGEAREFYSAHARMKAKGGDK